MKPDAARCTAVVRANFRARTESQDRDAVRVSSNIAGLELGLFTPVIARRRSIQPSIGGSLSDRIAACTKGGFAFRLRGLSHVRMLVLLHDEIIRRCANLS